MVERLPLQAITLWRLHGLFWLLPVLGGLGLRLGLGGPLAAIEWAAWLAALMLLGAVIWTLPARFHSRVVIALDDRAVVYERGYYIRRLTVIPRSRLQYADVSQGPIERALGLGTLIVYTAGLVHGRVAIDGLTHLRALELRDALVADARPDVV